MTELRPQSDSLKKILWLIPVLLAVHNLEEALTMPQWMEANLWKVRETVPVFNLLHFPTPQLYLSLVLVTVVPFILAFFCLRGELSRTKRNILLTLQCIIFWNALVPHVSGVVVLQMYNPGTATALFINLPFSLYLFSVSVKRGMITKRGIRNILLIGLLLYLPAVYVNHLLAQCIALLV